MRGSVYKRPAKDGTVRWSWSFTIGTRKAGNRRTFSKGGYATRKEANAALTQALAAYQGKGDRRPLMKPTDMVTGEYLRQWLDGLQLERETTRRSYATVVDRWTKKIHRIPLKDLGPEDLLDLYQELREFGGRAGTGLSSRSVQLVATTIGMALRDAVETGKLAYNPGDRIPRRQRPKHTPEKKADRFWTPEEAASFLAATRDSRWWPLWCLALDSGARRGELAALRWSELDLDAGVMKVVASRTSIGGRVVEGPPKTKKSRRSVHLDGRTVAALRQHLRRQAEERLRAGEGWEGEKPGESGFVFVDEAGEPPLPYRFGDLFRQAQHGLGLPPLVLHGLRHTSATIALSAGVPIIVVSDRLGHSKVSITLDVYGHTIPTDEAAAATVIGAAIYASGTGS